MSEYEREFPCWCHIRGWRCPRHDIEAPTELATNLTPKDATEGEGTA